MSIILTPEKIIAETLLETLCTGVIACKLAQRLCGLIDGSIEQPRVNARATQGTFFARDNAANFLSWCRKLGVRKFSYCMSTFQVYLESPNFPYSIFECYNFFKNKKYNYIDIPITSSRQA